MTVDDLIADFEKDPVMKRQMESARAELEALKGDLGEEGFRDWLVGQFVNVDEVKM